MLTLSKLKTIMPHCKKPELFIDYINNVFELYKWNEIPIQASFLGQIAHESTELNELHENLNYSEKTLRKLFPHKFVNRNPKDYAYKPEKIANLLYANKYGNGDEASGDGWKYCGRGGIMITFHYNYNKMKEMLNIDCVDHPEMLEEPEWAIKTAGAYFKWQGLDKLALRNDLDKITKKVNTASLGGEQRKIYTIKAGEVLKWT